MPFFEHHLKGKGAATHPEAWVFETGTNVWRQHDAWPPRASQAQAFYFHRGRLSQEPPQTEVDEGFDEYVSDPDKPVPYQEHIDIRMSREYMVADQRFASRRTDVITYQTEILDRDVTVAGPVEAALYVSTTGTDSDWVVKLIDVYPDNFPDVDPAPTGLRMGGYQQLVRGDVMRGKFRDSYEKPEPFTPGKPTAVKWTLNDICHTFRSGHRIMIQVQSSWFPLVDRNPQTMVDIYAAKESDFHKATERIYRTHDLPSHVTLRVMPQPGANPAPQNR